MNKIRDVANVLEKEIFARSLAFVVKLFKDKHN